MALVTSALLAAAACCATAATWAGVGLNQLPATATDGPVTLFYPTDAPEQAVQRGPFHLNVAWQGMPKRGNGGLVVVSHGSGGAPWIHTDLARALVGDGFVVALPEHRGDNFHDRSNIGPQSWKLRPTEVSRAIDAVGRHPELAPLLSLDRVGVFGGSAGGHTALTLAGGRWSPVGFMRHCEAHLTQDFSSCVGTITRLKGNWLDGLKEAVALMVIRQRFADTTPQEHHDPRVQAAVAMVPFAADFDMATLVQPRIPMGLIAAECDVYLRPRLHVAVVRAACTRCEVIADQPLAGHGAMLSPLPQLAAGSTEAELLSDPPDFDRSQLPALNEQISAFFQRHRLPSP